MQVIREKAAWRGGGIGNKRQFQSYHPPYYLSRVFSLKMRKVPVRPANRDFETMRAEQFKRLLKASSPQERIAIRRGQLEGRRLRKELENM